MGIGFGNGGGMKGRNSDWKNKNKSSSNFGGKRWYRVGPKMNFIIWSYLEDPIRVEKSKNLLKTYTHRCEASCKGCMAISSFGEQKQETASYRF
jgi:hypothetical protein